MLQDQGRHKRAGAMTVTSKISLFFLLLSPAHLIVAEELTFALVPKQVNNTFFDTADEGCKDKASKIPGVSCIYVGPADEGDAQAQVDIIDDLIAGKHGKIDGISLSVSDEEIATAAIQRAVEAGIPVVTFDSDAKNSNRTAYVGTNNGDFGEEMGKLLDQLRPQGGNYGIISSFAPNVRMKADGIRSRLESTKWKEDITSPKDCLGDIDIYYQQMEEFASDPNIDAILSVGSWPFLTTTDDTRWVNIKKKYSNVTTIASGTMPLSLKLFQMGYVDGIVSQLPFQMGELSVDALYRLNQGETLAEYIWGTAFMEILLFPLQLPHLTVDMNYIGKLAILGYAMFAMMALASIGSAAWTYANKNKRVVRASQPMFLGMICFGTLVMSSTMIPLTMDDEKYSQRATDIACMSLPWLMSVGFTTTFAALFSKTWRVNKIFHNPARFSRIKVTPKDVIGPYVGLMAVNVIALSCWTAIDPLVFRRKDHAGTDDWNRVISSYGVCVSEGNAKGGMWPYLVIILVVNLGVLALANVQSYQARSIRTEFSESKYIAIIMASMLEAFVIGIPILALVSEDPKVLFVILVCLISVVCFAVLVFMFVPKFLYLNEKKSLPTGITEKKSVPIGINTTRTTQAPSSIPVVPGSGSENSVGRSGLKVDMPTKRSVGTSEEKSGLRVFRQETKSILEKGSCRGDDDGQSGLKIGVMDSHVLATGTGKLLGDEEKEEEDEEMQLEN